MRKWQQHCAHIHAALMLLSDKSQKLQTRWKARDGHFRSSAHPSAKIDRYQAELLKIAALKTAHLTGSDGAIHMIIDQVIRLHRGKQEVGAGRWERVKIKRQKWRMGLVPDDAARSLDMTATRPRAVNLLVNSDSSNPHITVSGRWATVTVTSEEGRERRRKRRRCWQVGRQPTVCLLETRQLSTHLYWTLFFYPPPAFLSLFFCLSAQPQKEFVLIFCLTTCTGCKRTHGGRERERAVSRRGR